MLLTGISLSHLKSGYSVARLNSTIRDFPDYATFREKGAKLACADKLGVFLSLTLCNEANFDPLQQVKYDSLENVKQEKIVWIVHFFLI